MLTSFSFSFLSLFFFCLRIAPLPEERLTRWTADAADATTVVVDQVNVSKSSTMTARSSVFTELFFKIFQIYFRLFFSFTNVEGPSAEEKGFAALPTSFSFSKLNFSLRSSFICSYLMSNCAYRRRSKSHLVPVSESEETISFFSLFATLAYRISRFLPTICCFLLFHSAAVVS